MNYHQIKLAQFTKYLLEKDMVLLSAVSPLGITGESLLLTTAEEG